MFVLFLIIADPPDNAPTIRWFCDEQNVLKNRRKVADYEYDWGS